MKKWIIAITVFILSFALMIIIGFYAAIFLIGPHSGILPQFLFIPVGLLLVVLILGIPLLLAKSTYLGIDRNENKTPSD